MEFRTEGMLECLETGAYYFHEKTLELSQFLLMTMRNHEEFISGYTKAKSANCEDEFRRGLKIMNEALKNVYEDFRNLRYLRIDEKFPDRLNIEKKFNSIKWEA